MTPEARKWLMLWTLRGRPLELDWPVFITAPEEVFAFLPEADETLRDAHVRSQRYIYTGRYPTISLTRRIYTRHRDFRVDMHPHFPTPPDASRTYFYSFAEAKAHAQELVQRMETEHWHWRQ